MMEDDERQKKLQAGKAKLAEYRQRKALSDGQKKQKKKKKKVESEEQRRDDEDQTLGEQRGDQTTVFSLSKTLRSGETVTHDQTYTIEPESEMSTTAEDCSSEVNGFQERTGDGVASVMGEDEETHVEPDHQSGSPAQIMQDELAAKTLAMEELSQELDEIRAAFGTEGVQQLQDFEEALKQRDEIITQLTTNLQQARVEKEDVMREFLELTEQSQKLQIQFQQLQTGQILRSSSISSSISSSAADLLQARQQISLHQQQLEERDAQVKGHQEKTQEHLLLISQLQERLDQADRIRSQSEQSSSERLQEKDLLNAEQQRLISGHALTLSHLQDEMLTTTQQLDEVNKHLSAKTQELENCERELSASRQKERMSSTEILQLMKTVEDLQQRCHQGSQSEGQTIQRIEEDWTRRMDQLRAELDEMYGQQIAQMKQELRVQHASEMDRMREQHSEDTEMIVLQHRSELERFKGQLSHSTADINVLNVRLIELQQKLQESQVLREMAERERTQSNAENIDLVNQMERLHQEVQSAIRSKSPERSRTETQLLHDAISDLQSQLDAAQKTAVDLEAKHESEITNYKIKLDMLEREKDAVLDRMAESLEAELERLRTQLLFSHEEELSRLRHDLQRESQLNGENLRDEMAVRHRESVELLRMDFEDRLRSAENERAALAAERGALLQDISMLKSDLNRATESSRAEELVLQLRELQTETENLKRRGKTKEEDWERMEYENKILKETNTAMRDELMILKEDREVLLQKTQHLSLENEQTHMRLKDLQNEIEKQRNTFSFAEKNFEVNYQELKDEYTCLVNAKVQLEERLIKATMDYETKLGELRTRNKSEDDEALVEKDATELMEKLETSEREKKILTQRLSESVAQVRVMEADVKRLQEELKRDRGETAEDCGVAGGQRSREAHRAHIRCLEEKTETLKSSLMSAEQEHGSDLQCLSILTQENSAPVKWPGVYRDPSSQAAAAAQQSEGGERELHASTTAEAPAERTHAAAPAQQQSERGEREAHASTTAEAPAERTHAAAPAQQQSERGEREPHASTTAEAPAERTHAAAAAHEDVLTEPDGRRPQQVKTNDPEDDGDSVRTQCLKHTQDMDDSDHDECRLQLEAQRISLSQIHAAQLELLRESLHAQTEAQLRSRDQALQDAHERELRCLQEEMRSEQQEVRGHSEEFQERHRQETERLKIYYHQKMEETQERCTADILLLKRRLQELTGTQELFSMPSVSAPLTTEKPCEHDQDEESLSTEGLSRELQAVQEAQSESERQMKHHQELLEEEIAKAIVQMSVEFAQRTEHTRLDKKARETSTSTQTLNAEDLRLTDPDAVTMTTSQQHTQGPEEEDDGDEEHRPAVPLEDFGSELVQQEEEHTRVLDFLRASHTHQMEILQEQNTHLTTQIHTLNQQLIQREQELIGETQRDDLMHPIMQSSSTQTEQNNEDEETKSRGREEPVTSQQPAQELLSDVIVTERDLLRKANSRLRQVLVDVLKTTEAAEETIGRHVEGILQGSSKESFQAFSAPAGDTSSETAAEDAGMFSGELGAEEGLERSQGADLQLQEAEFELEREEHLMSISTRLQSAVKKLFITITETSTKLEHAHITQTELMREKFRHNEEMEELVIRQEELQERLRVEARGREQLALELHKAEGLIDGYTGERLALEQQGRERAELQLHLEQELRVTSNRLHELEHERQQIQQERELVSRQQDAMREGAGSRELRLVEAALDAAPEADLLEETEKLMAEKVEVQRQAQKESGELLQQVKQLEAELEEQVNRVQELEETRGTEAADLAQQIQALEKQLEKNRKFMDEQAADREHERDVFQQEIQNLEQQLKNPQKTQTGSERREREMQELSSALQEKSDWCSELLLSSEQLQRDVQERDEEIETLGARVRELELMHRVEEVQHVSMAGSGGDVTLEEQLQTEKEALDRKEKEIMNLEEQLEQFREELENKSEEVNQLHMQLEIQRKEISSHQHDLQAQSRLTQVLEEKDGQIAVLNAQISKVQHTGTDTQNEAVQEKNGVIRELESQLEHLRSEQERLKRNNEEEMDQLNAVVEKLQQELLNIEHKQPHEEETYVGKDDYQEMKQKMDEVTKELDTLKSHQRSLLSKYEDLQEETLSGRHAETVAELQEALQEKTAASVVGQAQVQALEESASSKVMDLRQRVEDLEMCVEEKDSELRVCRMKVERAQSDAEALFCKVAQLEEKLREKVAAVLVAQAQLGAVQTQSKELYDEAQDVTSKLCATRTQLGPRMKVQSKDTQSLSDGPSVKLESGGPKKQPEGPKTQSEGPKTQSEDPKAQSEGLHVQLESEGPKTQSEDPKAQSEGLCVQLESEGPKTQPEDPKAQSEDQSVQLKSEGPKTQSEDPKAQSEDQSVQLKSEGPKTQPEDPKAQSEDQSVQLKSEGPKTQSEDPKAQSEGPSVQLKSEGPETQSEDPKAQSEGPSVQLEPEGPKTQPEDPKAQSESPSVQLKSEGPKTQSEDPKAQSEDQSVQLKSEGPKTQSEDPKAQSEDQSVQLKSEGPKTQSEDPKAQSEDQSVQLKSEGPKTQSEDPKAQSEDQSVQLKSEGPKTQSEDPKAQSEGPSVQLKSEGPKTQSEDPKAQSEGPSVQLEPEGPKTQPEDPKAQSESPSVQLKSEGPKTQSEDPKAQSEDQSVQLKSEGPKTQSEDPKAQSEDQSVQLKSEGPKTQSEDPKAQSEDQSVQLKSEGPKTQSEDPKAQSEGPCVQLEPEGPKTQSENPKAQSEGPSVQLEPEGSKTQSEGTSVQLDPEGLRVAAVASSTGDKVSLLTEKLKELEEGLSGMQKDQELQMQLLCSSEEEVQEYERRLALLMDLLNQMRTKASHHRPDSSDEVTDGSQSVTEILQQLQEVKGEAASTKEELKCYRELSHKLQADTEMKESTITQLQTALTQMSAGTGEKDTAEAVKLLKEVKGQLSITQQELESFRDQSNRLQVLLQEREMNIALLKDQLHRQTSREEDGSTSELLHELQEVKDEAASTKEELNNYRECSLKLQEQIEVRDVSIAQLKEEVQELRALTEAIDELPSQPKNKHEDNREHHGKNKSSDLSKDTPPLSHEVSSDQSELSTSCSSLNGTHVPSRVDAETQADLSGAVDVEDMITGYTEKIGQMQELHAAEIMDMEARHISESESLKTERQELEERCAALGDALQKLRSAEGPSVRSERPSVSPFKEGYTSDSSSEWGQRSGCDLPHPHQELRTTPEGARRDVEPDVLPDRIKTLLREVHQEGMQVLSLSEAERSGEQQLHHQTWSVERDALINSIQSLIDVISQIQRHTQVDGDWRADLLSAIQQVFVRERDVLKNFLHSHVERLDSTDVVIHLNQMLREITEQDVRHRDVMGLLCTADRNSLITEIHQLRAQRHPVDTSAGNRERESESEELHTELKQTQLDLESSLKSQHRLMKDLDTVRAEVLLKTAELDTLNDTLASEQKRVRELQWLYEKDKCKADRKQEAEREEVEDLKLMLEEQRARVSELSSALERETQMSRDQTDGEQVCEVQLEAQRCHAAEISSALEREKHLNAQLMQQMQTSVTPAAGTHDTLMQAEATCSQVESLLQTLQSQLAEKQTQVVQLMEQMEKQKLDELQLRRQFEEEKSSLTRSATQDQSEMRAARDSATRLERQTDDLRMQLDAERDDLQRLETERDGLQERVRQLEEKLRLMENKESVRSDGQSADRTLDWVLQQKTSETQDSSTPSGANQSSDPKHVNNILNRLQLIAAKITSLTSDMSDRLSVEAADRDSLTWLHNNVQDVMSLLQHIPSAPSALPESGGLLMGSSSSLLNERLLRQNAELTGFVSRLTEEKNDLRNQLLRLEEELHRHRQRNFNSTTVSLRSSAERHDSERDVWIHERSRLEKSLRRAEAELSRVRADVRSDALRDLTGSDVDSSALKKIYCKYLRAESFRKALIYQKKYLLLLLGGFQECEEATLSLIARMGGHPTHTCPESLGHRRRGFTRFRSAVRVSIALSRMKFLAKRWQRAAGGSLTSQIISRNGQMTGADVRNESSYLHPGGVDVFRERRAGSRGRTGRESPRSATSVTHRYHSMAGDSGGLSCSHLQNYDPDRALTDYISRLEALQRRLGSVQSGSNAQMHFGVRR
ncbi:A-kinase anchor protein 9 isoform X3 [Triplophysa dalaica]|uniref:A-kinase anchor protein 9 isoform X3 n=1 Tax=Triplophysa dalaica TaxID=1582913 RepID=UPI0024DF64B1|nr:A-kinase anchor protein 9 isoform X3 [Triplophysa dalaica]